MKSPKRYECRECGHLSDKTKSLKMPGITFAVCEKCRGPVKEREEWSNWIDEQRKRQIEQAKQHNNGYIMGVKVADV